MINGLSVCSERKTPKHVPSLFQETASNFSHCILSDGSLFRLIDGKIMNSNE